ncbi:MAG: hypothetical protein IPM46_11510 [Flavobacteriales bacterium]|nr:hypothetical protein [Flavobacteriales bacterium]
MMTWRSMVIICMTLDALICAAQPQPPSVTFTLAEDKARPLPLSRAHVVVSYCRYSNDYNYDPEKAGRWVRQVFTGGPLFADTTSGWVRYGMYDSYCNKGYLLIIADADTMRLEFPDSSKVHWRLMQRAWGRWDQESPEVIRFRKGTYSFEELIADPWAVETANAFAKRLIAEGDAAYKQQLAELEAHYRNQPPPRPPAAPYIPPPPMTPEQWEAEVAARPGLKEVHVKRVSADTVWVHITGRVMLNGACGSGMPLFGVEMRTDTGWVERIPFELVQMDCGMPWADWEDHGVVLPPLRWWVRGSQPADGKELLPGSYRLVFMGANMEMVRTPPFSME